MNYKERKSYNAIKDAKTKIKKAKDDNNITVTKMDTLVRFIEENINVQGTKNIRTKVDKQKQKIKNNNEKLDILNSRLDKHQQKIIKISELRKEAEKFGN